MSLKRKAKKFLKRKHSKMGKEYKEFGKTPGYQELHKSRQATARLKRKSAEEGKPKTITVTSAKSGPLSSTEWHDRYKGGNVTPSSLRQYRGYERNFGK